MEEILKEKKEELERLFKTYNQTQQQLASLGQEILKTQGAIEQLEELLKKKRQNENNFK